jgi:DNA mismatch repair ATPase MutS
VDVAQARFLQSKRAINQSHQANTTDSFGPTVWENIDHLRESVRELETLHESLDDAVNEKISAGLGSNVTVALMHEELRSLRLSIANGEDRLAQVELKTSSSDSRLNALFPLLSSLSRRGAILQKRAAT